jgi:hypothetical protein
MSAVQRIAVPQMPMTKYCSADKILQHAYKRGRQSGVERRQQESGLAGAYAELLSGLAGAYAELLQRSQKRGRQTGVEQ